jgi:hypothetical protein
MALDGAPLAPPPLETEIVDPVYGTETKSSKNPRAPTVSSLYVLSVALHTASPVTVKETMRFDDVPPRKWGPPESP